MNKYRQLIPKLDPLLIPIGRWSLWFEWLPHHQGLVREGQGRDPRLWRGQREGGGWHGEMVWHCHWRKKVTYNVWLECVLLKTFKYIPFYMSQVWVYRVPFYNRKIKALNWKPKICSDHVCSDGISNETPHRIDSNFPLRASSGHFVSKTGCRIVLSWDITFIQGLIIRICCWTCFGEQSSNFW